MKWTDLPRPIRILAPMEDVTDTVFRRIVAAAGSPDVFFTEFAGADGLCGPRADIIGRRLVSTASEHPLVAQIWGNNPDSYRRVVADLRGRGFSGVDINMGCPIRKITRKGYCSALINTPSLAGELICAAQEAAGDLAVSVKTRIGFSRPAVEEWIGFLLSHRLDAITVHGRVSKQMSEGTADWGAIADAVRLRDELCPSTVIIGNGDIRSLDDMHARVEQSRVDGFMVGRGIFDNLFIFRSDGRSFTDLSAGDRVRWMRRHFRLHREQWGEGRNYHALKKFVSLYLQGCEEASALADTVLGSNSIEAGLQAMERFIVSDCVADDPGVVMQL